MEVGYRPVVVVAIVAEAIVIVSLTALVALQLAAPGGRRADPLPAGEG